MRKTRLPLLLTFLLVIPAAAFAQFDERGSYVGGDPELTGEMPAEGDACGECKEPDLFSWGVAFRGSTKWVVDLRRTLYRLDNCHPAEGIPLAMAPLPAGLGYDFKRDLFILTDASQDQVILMTPSGRMVERWPAPGPGPVGAAYDSRRDLYWISDWELDQLYSIDPQTSLPGPAMEVPGGSRISGTAYDVALDALVYHGRNEASTYWVSVETEEIIGIFPVPQGGKNNGAGAGIDPNLGNLWLTHNEDPRLFCLKGLSSRTSRPGKRDRRDQRFQEQGANGGPQLGPAFPNPFNPVTRIQYVMPVAGFADLAIFDVRGRLVETLVSKRQLAGEHTVEWRANHVASGIYFYRLTVGDVTQTRKVILLK